MTADDIRHRLAAATPGPWEWKSDHDDSEPYWEYAAGREAFRQGDNLGGISGAGYNDSTAGIILPAADAVLLEHLHADLAYLLDQLDTLRNAGQQLADALRRYVPRREGVIDSPNHMQGRRALEGWRAACGNTTRQEQG